MHQLIFIKNILPYVFIALIALPLPLLMLATPIQHLYEKYLRYRYYNIVKHYCENPYQVEEEQLLKIFPGIKPEKLNQIACLLEEDFTYSDN
jgi:hypothetical protein